MRVVEWWAELAFWKRLLGTFVVIVVALIGYGTIRAVFQEPSPQVELDLASEVVYEVEGDVGSADVTLVTPTGMEQQSVAVPMRTKVGGAVRFTFVSGSPVVISAQKKGAEGSITCRILVDGLVVSQNTSTVAYGIASCRGSA